jgi:hypothetical protein
MLRNILLCGVALLLSCGGKTPTFDTIDSTQWKHDRNACSGYRQGIRLAIENDIAKLKGLSENDLFSLLGRPDQNELYKRNQKFYSYFLTPGPACAVPDTVVHRLILRFNAMGYAQQVTVE